MVLRTYHMLRSHVATHLNIVFLYDRNSIRALELLPNSLPVILLGLNDVATKHLWVLDFDLRVVENIIIVVDVLYYFNRLVSFFLLRL